MTRCTICGKKVPKKRTTSGPSEYSGFFCGTKCHLQYSDQMMKMMRETELEVEDELKRETGTLGSESWTAEALDALDKAATTATSGDVKSPEEIAAKFLGAFAGKFGVKFATRLYGNFSDMAKEWARKRAEKKEAAAQEPPPPAPSSPPPKTPPPSPSARTQAPPPQAAGHKNGAAPPNGAPRAKHWKKIPEPEDLDELPLEEQKEWLLRRFYLPPTATMDDVKTAYKQVAKRYHPDNRTSGNGAIMAVVNTTKSRLEELFAELETRAKRKEAKRAKEKAKSSR